MVNLQDMENTIGLTEAILRETSWMVWEMVKVFGSEE